MKRWGESCAKKDRHCKPRHCRKKCLGFPCFSSKKSLDPQSPCPLNQAAYFDFIGFPEGRDTFVIDCVIVFFQSCVWFTVFDWSLAGWKIQQIWVVVARHRTRRKQRKWRKWRKLKWKRWWRSWSQNGERKSRLNMKLGEGPMKATVWNYPKDCEMLPKICRLSDLRLTSGASKWLWIRQRSRRIGIRSDSHKSKINNRAASTDRLSCCFFDGLEDWLLPYLPWSPMTWTRCLNWFSVGTTVPIVFGMTMWS